MSRSYGIVGKFWALPASQLQVMLTQWQNCLTAVAANQSYSMAGRTFTRAQLEEVSNMVGELSNALALQQGRLVRTTFGDMS